MILFAEMREFNCTRRGSQARSKTAAGSDNERNRSSVFIRCKIHQLLRVFCYCSSTHGCFSFMTLSKTWHKDIYRPYLRLLCIVYSKSQHE